MTLRPRLPRWFALLLALVLVAAACSSGGGDSGDETATGDDGAGEETTEPTEESGAGCLVGEWTRNRASYLEGFGGFLERVGGPTLGDNSGDARLTIDDSRLVSTLEEYLVVLLLGGAETRVITSGDQSGDYTVTGDVVTVTAVESTLETDVTVSIGGVETDIATLGIDVDAFVQENAFLDPVPFICDGDVLTFVTVVPDLGEMFTVSYDRIA